MAFIQAWGSISGGLALAQHASKVDLDAYLVYLEFNTFQGLCTI